MALLATESFDCGNTSTNIILSGGASINSTGGVYNTGCAFFPSSASWISSYLQRNFRTYADTTSNTSINFSFWFKADAAPTSIGNANKIIHTRSLKEGVGFGLGLQTNGRWYVVSPRDASQTDGYFASVAYSSIGPNCCDNQWHFIEAIHTLQSSNRYTYLYQDGQLIVTFPTISTPNFTYTRHDTLWFTNIVNAKYWIDDLTIWDQLGATSTFVGYPKGPLRIISLRPTSDFSSVNATSTGATNYEVLDEEFTANSNDYVTLSNTSNIVLGVANVFSNTTNVFGFITYAFINSGQGGISNIKIGHTIDTTNSYCGAQTIITQAYSTYQHIAENNFATGGGLLLQNVNDLLVSVEKVP